ncbi:hypothetical protein Sspor_15600 [Streptomyces spororaveus]|uniref:Insertion element IS402-like domain-containing protein n=1 Tax=Streptomyces spororaveus TaxID=284039 RepID=A0ABQ3T6L1_9ACTN|nr:hypothetical protein Sspor_15600 [Streptomyces spororaveus]
MPAPGIGSWRPPLAPYAFAQCVPFVLARLVLLIELTPAHFIARPGPPTWSRRQLIDGIRWRTRAGTPWRDVPERYGPWDRSYDLFRRWQRNGPWKRILEQLQVQADGQGLIIGMSALTRPLLAHISTLLARVKWGPAA